jgi:hypothetical protein
MEVQFTPEQEAQLAAVAARTGTRPEVLVRDAALRLLTDQATGRDHAAELPMWRLGSEGAMHRRDIYDDVA